jgi:hypothetical protein
MSDILSRLFARAQGSPLCLAPRTRYRFAAVEAPPEAWPDGGAIASPTGPRTLGDPEARRALHAAPAAAVRQDGGEPELTGLTARDARAFPEAETGSHPEPAAAAPAQRGRGGGRHRSAPPAGADTVGAGAAVAQLRPRPPSVAGAPAARPQSAPPAGAAPPAPPVRAPAASAPHPAPRVTGDASPGPAPGGSPAAPNVFLSSGGDRAEAVDRFDRTSGPEAGHRQRPPVAEAMSPPCESARQSPPGAAVTPQQPAPDAIPSALANPGRRAERRAEVIASPVAAPDASAAPEVSPPAWRRERRQGADDQGQGGGERSSASAAASVSGSAAAADAVGAGAAVAQLRVRLPSVARAPAARPVSAPPPGPAPPVATVRAPAEPGRRAERAAEAIASAGPACEASSAGKASPSAGRRELPQVRPGSSGSGVDHERALGPSAPIRARGAARSSGSERTAGKPAAGGDAYVRGRPHSVPTRAEPHEAPDRPEKAPRFAADRGRPSLAAPRHRPPPLPTGSPPDLASVAAALPVPVGPREALLRGEARPRDREAAKGPTVVRNDVRIDIGRIDIALPRARPRRTRAEPPPLKGKRRGGPEG